MNRNLFALFTQVSEMYLHKKPELVLLERVPVIESERAKRFEAKGSDFNGLHDFGRSPKNVGQFLPQHGHAQNVTTTDDVDDQTNSDNPATGENHLRNPKSAQGLHKIHTSFCEECQPEGAATLIHSDLAELAALWSMLDNDIRYSIMTIARKTVSE